MAEGTSASELKRLESGDRFTRGGRPEGFSVGDFWGWILGDLRMNTTRGMLAEYLVAQAVGSRTNFRIEWAAYDVEAPNGTRIEVKASGYSQSWDGPDSKPSFRFGGGLKSKNVWNPDLGKSEWTEAVDRLDVWVFALHGTKRAEDYDPLDLDRWTFQVVPHVWLIQSELSSAASPATFQGNGFDPIGWESLESEIQSTAAHNERLRAGFQTKL